MSVKGDRLGEEGSAWGGGGKERVLGGNKEDWSVTHAYMYIYIYVNIAYLRLCEKGK
jgi:hypothetical protein